MLGLLLFFSGFRMFHRPSYNISSPLLEFVFMYTVDNTTVSDIMTFWNVTRYFCLLKYLFFGLTQL